MLGASIVVILVGHVLGDFYFQTDAMAQKKKSSRRFLIWHCAEYSLVILPFCLAVFPLDYTGLLAWAALSASHAFVDIVKIHAGKDGLRMFVLDQLAHVTLCVCFTVVLADFSRGVFAVIPTWMGLADDCYRLLFEGALIFLVVWRPSACFVRLIVGSCETEKQDTGLGEYVVEEKRANLLENPNRLANSGWWIGVFERTLVAMLSIIGEYGAIAFVLTAKSIARYKSLDEEGFAEKYLVGTLASSVCAIGSVLAIGAIASI